MTETEPRKPRGEAARSDAAELYRSIPPIHAVVEALVDQGWPDRVGRSVVGDAVRAVVDAHRRELGADRDQPADVAELARRAGAVLEMEARPPLRSIINATGIIVHTGLGRAPMAETAVRAVAEAAGHYSPVELELATGERGRRSDIVRKLLCELTGAESATVVNNNTGALLLTLSTLAKGRSVVVSRGELIEIGGSFRLPDVIKASGAMLREVGTTNRTKRSDYERSIDESTGALLKMHTSNYRIEGFTRSVSVGELVEMGRRHGLPVVHDIGSGVLKPASQYGLPGNEPDAWTSIAAQVDLVLFSGDKLLGGPQAGVIVGRGELIERLESQPMMRALRVDKVTLAGLGVTLQLHRDPKTAVRRLPVLAAAARPTAELEARAEALAARLATLPGVEEAQARQTSAYLGGGSVPAQAVASAAVRVTCTAVSESELARRLRMGEPAVVPTVRDGALWLDLRTVFEEQDDLLHEAVRTALHEPCTGCSQGIE